MMIMHDSYQNSDYCPHQEFYLNRTTTVTIQTPLFASSYPNNLRCTWFVMGTQPGYLHIRFLSFVGLETDYDFLDIGHGRNISDASQVLHLSGIFAPNSITIQNDAWILFTLNEKYRWYGFELGVEWKETQGKCKNTESM